MLTGRPTIAISRSRSGTRAGAMSGSLSLNGRECRPGTQNPVTQNSPITSSPPTRVRSRSLVPCPSPSNGAPSFHSLPRDGAASQDDARPLGNRPADGAYELLELLRAAAKRQTDDVLAFLIAGELVSCGRDLFLLRHATDLRSRRLQRACRGPDPIPRPERPRPLRRAKPFDSPDFVRSLRAGEPPLPRRAAPRPQAIPALWPAGIAYTA